MDLVTQHIVALVECPVVVDQVRQVGRILLREDTIYRASALVATPTYEPLVVWRNDNQRVAPYMVAVTLVETTIARELLAPLSRDAQADLVLLSVFP